MSIIIKTAPAKAKAPIKTTVAKTTVAPAREAWKILRENQTAVHKTGLAVSFGNRDILDGKIVGISGLELLNGTEWNGFANLLVEQAISLWQTHVASSSLQAA